MGLNDGTMTSNLPPAPDLPGTDEDAARALEQWVGDDRFMQSLARGLLALGAVARGKGRPVSVQEIAAATGLSAATVRRCLYTLNATGHVRANRNGAVPGIALAALAADCAASSPLISACGPILDTLHADLGVTVSLSTFEGGEAMIVATCSTDSLLKVDVPVGSILPLHCSATGKLYLASLSADELDAKLQSLTFKSYTPRTILHAEALRVGLEEIRKSGIAIVEQELSIGLRSASAGITNLRGTVIGSLNASTLVQVTTKRELRSHIIPALKEAAAQLSRLVP